MKVPTRRVRELRRHQTDAEREVCHLLRGRRAFGLKFHRQYPIGRYVVDFYCFDIKLAVELDGGAHSQPSQQARDGARADYLRQLGIRVLRIPNAMVLEDPEAFRAKIGRCQLRLDGEK